MARKQVKEKTGYIPATEVQLLAARLIDRVHGHLAEANICYLFRTGKWESKGKVIYGKAEKVSQKWNYLTEHDFIITINHEAWQCATEGQKKAILDHELTHCEKGEDSDGNPKWLIIPHSVEDFPSIIRRHGLWSRDLQNMIKAHEEYKQATIFSSQKTGTDG